MSYAFYVFAVAVAVVVHICYISGMFNFKFYERDAKVPNIELIVPDIVRRIGETVIDGIDAVNDEYLNNIDALDELITNAIGSSSDPTSGKVKCLRLQSDKLLQARKEANDEATKLKLKLDKHCRKLLVKIKEIMESMPHDSKADSVVHLCVKELHPGLKQKTEAIKCINDYGTDLTVSQKDLGYRKANIIKKFQQYANKNDLIFQVGITMVRLDDSNKGKFNQMSIDYLSCLDMV